MIRTMAEAFIIKGGNKLNGEVHVQGSKNAATKLIAATLLTKKPCKLLGVPNLKDVDVMLNILEQMGANVERKGNIVRVTAKNIDPKKLPFTEVKKLRASIVLLGPLLARFGYVKFPYPGGDKIGSRTLSTHFNAFSDLGFIVRKHKDYFTIKAPDKRAYSKVKKLVLDEFSVTATENILMYASSVPHRIQISIVAEEPHIQNLVELLRKMGAKIQVFPRHQISIYGSKKLSGVTCRVIPDYIEAGTFVAAALVAGNNVKIHNFPIKDLELFLLKLQRCGANIKFLGSKTVQVTTSPKFRLTKVQTMIHPGIPTDLQSQLGVLATQSPGKTLIHDTLYEDRLDYLKRLQKMGAKVKILDPHRAEVFGPTKLKGAEIEGKDIRGGMSLIIAGLIASGETVINNAYQVDRGYENIDERLRALGADIKRL